MPRYRYRARDLQDKPVAGTMEANSEWEAMQRLQQSHRAVTHLTEIRHRNFSLDTTIGTPKLKEESLSLMCSQFSILLRAGMPLMRAIQLVAQQMTQRELRRILTQVCAEVAGGQPLSESFARSGPGQIPVSLVEMLRAGEQSGQLEFCFSSLHTYYDKSAKTRKKIQSAMYYPIFLLLLAFVVVGIILVVAMPVFTQMFSDLAMQLPLPTRVLIGLSAFVGRYWPILVLLLFTLVMGFAAWGQTDGGQLHRGQLRLHLPVFGRVTQMRGSAQLAGTLACLLQAGIPLSQGVAICTKVLDNRYLGAQLATVVTGLEEGKSFGTCLGRCNCFPSLLVEMAAVGEETGALADTLLTVGAFYDTETQIASQRALGLLQPAITLFMGALIGLVVVALYLPMFSMYSGL